MAVAEHPAKNRRKHLASIRQAARPFPLPPFPLGAGTGVEVMRGLRPRRPAGAASACDVCPQFAMVVCALRANTPLRVASFVAVGAGPRSGGRRRRFYNKHILVI